MVRWVVQMLVADEVAVVEAGDGVPGGQAQDSKLGDLEPDQH